MIMNMIIEEIEKMTKKAHTMATIMITMKANETTRDQNYHTILINTAKDTTNEDITLKIVYY